MREVQDLQQPQVNEDEKLASRARSGDPEAFGELVAKYRAKAYGWAKHMTADAHLAEDIVQEALLKAFMHVSHLHEPSRFAPWLQRIVRNQVNKKMRRGGPYGKEQPFTSYMPLKETDWANLDYVLFHLTQSADQSLRSNSPLEPIIRKETIAGIRALLNCLTKKERAVFEAYFFEQLPPAEIAKLFQTKVGNVYNFISRSRWKVQQERVRVHLNQYVQNRKKQNLPKRRVLDMSEIMS